MIDRPLLAKILARTASSSDGEALTAVRKANEHIRKEGTTWAEVLGVDRVAIRPKPFAYSANPSRSVRSTGPVKPDWQAEVADMLRQTMEGMAYNLGRGLRGDRRRGR